MSHVNRLAAAVVGSALILGGCRKDQDNKAESAPRDHHPAPEGRLHVDQSAVLPVDVKAGVQREYPGATVQNVTKRTYDDRVVRYEVSLTTKDGRQQTRVFDANGKPYTEGK